MTGHSRCSLNICWMMKEQVGTSLPKNTWRQWKDGRQPVESHLRAARVGTPALHLPESWGTAARVAGGPAAEVTFVPWILPSRSVPCKRTPLSFLRHALNKHPLVNNYWNTLTSVKIHILWQDKKNVNIKNFLCPLASSPPSTVHCISALRIHQTSPSAGIPAQP